MFGVNGFILKTILLLSIISVVLVEGNRQKKDVHHMIYLNERPRPPKIHRHKSHSHSSGRLKRRPSRDKYNYSSSPEEESHSVEDDSSSSEEYIPHKTKSKRQQHNHNHQHHKSHKRHKDYRNHKGHRKHENHRHHHSNDDNRIHNPESVPFPDGKWKPMTSQELFGPGHYQTRPVFPGGYQNGVLHLSQPVPMEITTPLPLSNSFVSYESTLYPPLSSAYNMAPTAPQSPLIGTVESYKPYDYSVLEQETQNGLSKKYPSPHDATTSNAQHTAVKVGTPFSIIVDGSAEKGEKDKKNEDTSKNIKKNRDKRVRGTNRFRVRSKM